MSQQDLKKGEAAEREKPQSASDTEDKTDNEEFQKTDTQSAAQVKTKSAMPPANNVPKAIVRQRAPESNFAVPRQHFTPGRVRHICKQLILMDWDHYEVHVDAKGQTSSEKKAFFERTMSEHFRSESWFANYDMDALAKFFSVAFINLEVKPGSAVGGRGLAELQLSERGQIMPPGNEPTRAQIFTLWSGTHFNLLLPCQELEEGEFVWQQSNGEEIRFAERQAPKDNACGYWSTSLGFNTAGILVPEAFQEPARRSLVMCDTSDSISFGRHTKMLYKLSTFCDTEPQQVLVY